MRQTEVKIPAFHAQKTIILCLYGRQIFWGSCYQTEM